MPDKVDWRGGRSVPAWVRVLFVVSLTIPVVFTRPARGQPELIVRLGPDVSPGLASFLEDPAGKSPRDSAAWGMLFEGALSARRTFSSTATSAGKREAGFDRIFTLQAADSSAMRVLLDRWAARPGVAYAIPNRRYDVDIGDLPPIDDAYRDSLSHLDVIGVTQAWARTRGASTVRIGFVDTGVFFEHPDLEGQFWVNPGEDLNANGRFDLADLDGLDNDGNGYVDDLRGFDFVDRAQVVDFGDYRTPDPDASEDVWPRFGAGRGHGTLIAGVLGATADNAVGIAGVAPGARLVPLRAFGSDGAGEDDDVAEAILYAADLGLDVLNLSFGDAYYSPLMHDAVRYASARGTIVVASAGNDGGDWPHFPSDYPEVISVGWLNEAGTNRGFRASHGVHVDLAAPATRVYTTLLPRAPESGALAESPDSLLYGRRSGSSMAAPQAAGAAALLRSLQPDLSPEAVRGILTATARDVDQPGWEPGWDQYTGAGLLQVGAALNEPYPARVRLRSPVDEAGLSQGAVDVRGSVLTPLFDRYVLAYAVGDDEPDGRWIPIVERRTQVVDGLLGTWNLEELADTTYVLRLAAVLKNGRRIEDRRRVHVDRSPPDIHVEVLGAALSGARHGVLAEVVTDDFGTARMRVEHGAGTHVVESDRRGRRHGLFWPDDSRSGGRVRVVLEVENAAGLVSRTQEADLEVPAWSAIPDVLEDRPLGIPHGYLVDKGVDLDGDGLLEIVSTRLDEDVLGDTLAFYEWNGDGFTRRDTTILAPLIPRDVADTDGDGRLELLLQRSGYTAVAEQSRRRSLLFTLVYEDTTGLDRPDADGAVWGGLFDDLDQDGRGELLAHNRNAWRVLENNRITFLETARLENPTDPEEGRQGELGSDANVFTVPEALPGDFDGDGRRDVLLGDFDGDWFIYEQRGDDAFEHVWTAQTGRYAFANRFAAADFDGDGVQEFVTFNENWRVVRTDREYEAPYGAYYFWRSEGDDRYVVWDSLLVPGRISPDGTVAGGDVDGDGDEEVWIAHAPDLYVVDAIDNRLVVRAHLGDATTAGVRTARMAVDDFDGDGQDEAVIAMRDQQLHLISLRGARVRAPAPVWVEAVARDAQTVRLSWRVSGADSVRVYASEGDGSLDAVLTVREPAAELAADTERDYALQAWYGETASELSERRQVRPHAPAQVQGISYEQDLVRLTFTEPIAKSGPVREATLRSGRTLSESLVAENGRVLSFLVKDYVAGPDTLELRGFRDAEGMPVGATDIPLLFPVAVRDDLVLESWAVIGPGTVRLTFNKSLDPVPAETVQNYRVEPAGLVVSALVRPGAEESVDLDITGRALGATGEATTVFVSGLRAADGSGLADAGRVASFVTAAESLSDVFIFPNPHRAARNTPRVMVAGLPPKARVSIFSPDGRPVRALTESDGDGGVPWDLKDEQGHLVPSGVYLVHVEDEEGDTVVKKIALVR